MSALFTPITLRSVTLPNRIVVSPMCQYSAENGAANSWHLIHLGHLALSGAGMLCIEATAVESTGRITPNCLGLWDDATEAALVPVLAAIRRHSKIKVTMQIAHAGRKASSRVPWEGGQLIPIDEGGWLPDAPSSVPQKEGEPAPRALDRAGLARVRDAFVATATRRGSGLTVSRSMRRTVTYCTSSSRPSPTTAPTSMAARWRIGCAFPRGLRRRAGSVPGRPARGRAGLGHRLGRRWLGRPADDRLRSRVEEARCGLDRRFLGRRLAGPEDRARPRLPGALRTGDQGGHGRHHDCRGPDHRAAAGRRDRGIGPGRYGRPGARHPLRPALALARRGPTRRHGRGAAAILALAARSRKRCSGRRGSAGVRRISPCRSGIAPWLFAFARD